MRSSNRMKFKWNFYYKYYCFMSFILNLSKTLNKLCEDIFEHAWRTFKYLIWFSNIYSWGFFAVWDSLYLRRLDFKPKFVQWIELSDDGCPQFLVMTDQQVSLSKACFSGSPRAFAWLLFSRRYWQAFLLFLLLAET